MSQEGKRGGRDTRKPLKVIGSQEEGEGEEHT